MNDEQTFAAKLEHILPGVECVNCGVHGYAHDQMLLYLLESGARYEPDVVLLGFVTDDVERTTLKFRDFAKPRFEVHRGRLVLTGVPVPTPEHVLSREPYRSSLLDILSVVREGILLRTEWRWHRVWERDSAILREIFRVARGLGATPVVADLPVQEEIFWGGPGLTPREQIVADLCRAEQVPYLHLRPVFQAESAKGVTLRRWGHYGPIEHRIAAWAIADALVRSKAMPAPARR